MDTSRIYNAVPTLDTLESQFVSMRLAGAPIPASLPQQTVAQANRNARDMQTLRIAIIEREVRKTGASKYWISVPAANRPFLCHVGVSVFHVRL